MYKSHTGTDELQNRIFAYLREAHTVNGTNVAFVNLQTYVLYIHLRLCFRSILDTLLIV